MIFKIPFLPAISAAAFLLASASQLPAPLVWSENTWRYEKEGEEVASASSAEAQLAASKSYEDAGQAGRAISSYRAVVRRFPKSEAAPHALFRAAALLEGQKELMSAYDALNELVEKYPRSDKFNEALEAQFRIASQFLEGEKLKLLGVPTVPSMSRAAEMFESILKAGPYSRIAPAAQFNLGLAYEKAGRVPEAILAYENVVDLHPNSEFADDAFYQIGYVWMNAARGTEYDQGATQRAVEAFQEFAILYPNSDKVPQAMENLGRLESNKSAGSFSVAQFYDKQKNYTAAAIYYKLVLEQQPGSPDAEKAAKRLAEIEGSQPGAVPAVDESEKKEGFSLKKLLPSFGRDKKADETAAPGINEKPAAKSKPEAQPPAVDAAGEEAPKKKFSLKSLVPKVRLPWKSKEEAAPVPEPTPSPTPKKRTPKATASPAAAVEPSPAKAGEEQSPVADPAVPQLRTPESDVAPIPLPGQ